ncbi:MAG: LPXTG cell wall anchor domain-containing protein [Thaumarchaeota archaeon]|nr:MAG: LPXTG cell wall anchor domain-containing protein [Nitrososphaerota archaeon]
MTPSLCQFGGNIDFRKEQLAPKKNMSPGEAVFSVSPATLLGFPRPTTVQPRPLKAVPSVKMGVALIYSPTIGSTADGKIMAFLPVGGGILWGVIPGFIAAFSLVAPSGPSVTTSVSVSTSIVTTTVATSVSGPSTGIDPTTFYAVAGVAVILLITTGVLAIRRRKPAT